MTEVDLTVNALRRKFDASEVKQRQGPGGKKLDYVAIETVLGRLLDDAPGYSWSASTDHIQRIQYEKDDDIVNAWVVIVSGSLMVDGKVGTGFGAMQHTDPDMAVKSANSEAMKNAAKNGWGVGLELWDAEYRATLATDRAIAAGDPAALKAAVFAKFREQVVVTAPPTADDVADFFNVKASDLKKPEVLQAILNA